MAVPKTVFALPAELHRDAELLPSMVSEGTKTSGCVSVCMKHMSFQLYSLEVCVAQQSCELSFLKSVDLFHVQTTCWQPASDTHVFYSLIGETLH